MRLVVAALLVCCAPPLTAATILERKIEIDVRPDEVRRSTLLVVELEHENDLATWDEYKIPLNQNVTLVKCSAAVLDTKGKVREKIPQRRNHRLESTGFGLYTSRWTSVIPFPLLSVGERLRIEYTTLERPYYPASAVPLVLGVRQVELQVQIRYSEARLRWRVGEPDGGFLVKESPGVLEVSGRDLPPYEPPEHAPSYDSAIPLLWLAWDDEGSWANVGMWYDGMAAGAREDNSASSAVAMRLVDGLESPRERLEALVDYVRGDIRYESVGIGTGAFVPTPPAEVIERTWGDCKDMAELLSQMLGAVGIPSRAVLLRAGKDGRIDRKFPSPNQFNHMILAIPADAISVVSDDPVVEGFLFVDPTWDRGTIPWLPSSDRGRDVLLVDGADSRLIYIPDLAINESWTLDVSGTLSDVGDLQGRVRLEVRGAAAIHWIDAFAGGTSSEIEQALALVIGEAVAGSECSGIEWNELSRSVPTVELTADVVVPGIARGKPGRRAIRTGALGLFPEPRTLDDRSLPVVLKAGTRRTRWTVEVPAGWCPVESFDEELENKHGRIAVTIAVDADNRLTLVRDAELRRSRIEPKDLEGLRALATAQSRADKRHIRTRCPETKM